MITLRALMEMRLQNIREVRKKRRSRISSAEELRATFTEFLALIEVSLSTS